MLATAEDPDVPGTPLVHRTRIARAEPPTEATTTHMENAQVAAGVRNGLHADANDLTIRLLAVAEAERESDLGRQFREVMVLHGREKLGDRVLPGKTELASGQTVEIHRGPILGEWYPSKEVVRPFAHPEPTILERPPIGVNVRMETKDHGALDGPDNRTRHWCRNQPGLRRGNHRSRALTARVLNYLLGEFGRKPHVLELGDKVVTQSS